MDRLTLTLFELDCEQEAAKNKCFKPENGSKFMKFIFLFGISTTHFLPETAFAQPYIAETDTTVVSVEPETERQDDSSATVTEASAGVDKSEVFTSSTQGI